MNSALKNDELNANVQDEDHGLAIDDDEAGNDGAFLTHYFALFPLLVF